MSKDNIDAEFQRRVKNLRAKQLLAEDEILTQSQYITSSISNTSVYMWVLKGQMTLEFALSMSREVFMATALSHPAIELLVIENRMTIAQALLLSKDEVERPQEYLTQLINKTPEQQFRYELYKNNLGILPYQVELIVLLTFKADRTEQEARELELLQDPSTRKFAYDIVRLEFDPDKSAYGTRKLGLLLDPDAREYAYDVVNLEFCARTIQEDKALISLYMKICHKVVKSSASDSLGLFGYMHRTQLDAVLPQSCASQSINDGVDLRTIVQTVCETTGIDRLCSEFEFLIRKKLVDYYCKIREIPERLLTMPDLKLYLDDKTRFLQLAVLRYYIDSQTVCYFDDAVAALIEAIQDRMRARTFALDGLKSIDGLQAYLGTGVLEGATHQPSLI